MPYQPSICTGPRHLFLLGHMSGLFLHISRTYYWVGDRIASYSISDKSKELVRGNAAELVFCQDYGDRHLTLLSDTT